MKNPLSILALVALVVALNGCAAVRGVLGKTYDTQTTTNTVAQVEPVTNTVITAVRVVAQTNGITVTNTVTQTNQAVSWQTNLVTVTTTNLIDRPAVETTIQAAGAVTNAFLPGIGSILALALGGLYHGYRQYRNGQVTTALAQGVETARQIIQTTPQGQALDAQLVAWLVKNQAAANVIGDVSNIVQSKVDASLAELHAQQIAAAAAPNPQTPCK